MTIFPKRVWTKKGMVFHDKKPVWKLGDKLWVYDPNFTEVDSWKVYPEKAWENVPATDELLIYDWEQPTDIGTFEDWLESTYQFVDYDGTVLKSWKVKDGETPVAPTNPTREHYTFTGWNPTVWPINKNTTYSAVYAIDTFSVTISVNDVDYGSVNVSSLSNVPYGTTISASDNVLTIGETTITATAETWYQFSSWGTLPATVTENLTITATFEAITYSYDNWNDWEQLEEEIRDQLPEWIDVMMISGAKKVRTAGQTSTDIGWLWGWEWFGDWEVFVAVLSNSNVDVLWIAVKTEQELGWYEELQTLIEAFEMPDTAMTDAIWNQVMWWFSTTLTVTTSWWETTISDGSQSVIIDTTSHAMKYWADGLWTNDTSTEYNTIQTNGWLVDGTYWPYSIDSQENTAWAGVVDSIKNKSEIVCTITVAQESWYILISDWTNWIELKTSPTILRYHADYYTESSDVSTEYSTITTNWWDVIWTYNYVSVDNKKTVFDSLIASLKTKWIANATITHDTVAGEITMQNGQWSFTIMDKNLWATQIYEDGDNLSETNCGKYFQRWNNNWFDWTGTITTSSVQVDTTGYWPWNYYTGTDFIIPKYNWSNPSNGNLRWDTTDTEWARQWPAPSGYHVPSAEEWQNFVKMFEVIRPDAHSGINFKNTFAMPFAGYRTRDNGNINNQGYFGFYWTSSPRTTTASYELVFWQTSQSASVSDQYPACGYSVRCFKDSTPSL